MPEKGEKRRVHNRFEVNLRVRISTIEPERDAWTGRPFFRSCQERSANLSRGGVFVHTTEPIAPGRRILLELDLPGGEALEAIGRVAWTKTVLAPTGERGESGIGVKFIGGRAEQFAHLERFLTTSDD